MVFASSLCSNNARHELSHKPLFKISYHLQKADFSQENQPLGDHNTNQNFLDLLLPLHKTASWPTQCHLNSALFQLLTSHMENRFKSETKSSNFHRILLLNAVAQHSNAVPIAFGEYSIVVTIQSRSLHACV